MGYRRTRATAHLHFWRLVCARSLHFYFFKAAVSFFGHLKFQLVLSQQSYTRIISPDVSLLYFSNWFALDSMYLILILLERQLCPPYRITYTSQELYRNEQYHSKGHLSCYNKQGDKVAIQFIRNISPVAFRNYKNFEAKPAKLPKPPLSPPPVTPPLNLLLTRSFMTVIAAPLTASCFPPLLAPC